MRWSLSRGLKYPEIKRGENPESLMKRPTSLLSECEYFLWSDIDLEWYKTITRPRGPSSLYMALLLFLLWHWRYWPLHTNLSYHITNIIPVIYLVICIYYMSFVWCTVFLFYIFYILYIIFPLPPCAGNRSPQCILLMMWSILYHTALMTSSHQ